MANGNPLESSKSGSDPSAVPEQGAGQRALQFLLKAGRSVLERGLPVAAQIYGPRALQELGLSPSSEVAEADTEAARALQATQAATQAQAHKILRQELRGESTPATEAALQRLRQAQAIQRRTLMSDVGEKLGGAGFRAGGSIRRGAAARQDTEFNRMLMDLLGQRQQGALALATGQSAVLGRGQVALAELENKGVTQLNSDIGEVIEGIFSNSPDLKLSEEKVKEIIKNEIRAQSEVAPVNTGFTGATDASGVSITTSLLTQPITGAEPTGGGEYVPEGVNIDSPIQREADPDEEWWAAPPAQQQATGNPLAEPDPSFRGWSKAVGIQRPSGVTTVRISIDGKTWFVVLPDGQSFMAAREPNEDLNSFLTGNNV